MVFELASTNLVAEVGIIMIVLSWWQFAVAEFIGAPVMVIILVILLNGHTEEQIIDALHQSLKRIVADLTLDRQILQ